MYIRHVSIKNFRNYEIQSIDLHENLNIFIGDNAQGKTNLLESIFVASFGRSFRTTKDKELIKMDSEFASGHIEVQKSDALETVDFRIHNKLKKEFKINGVPIVKMAELIGFINCVIFSPEDLRLIKEGPQERRKFIDRELSHISPKYLSTLIEYNRVLNHRNQLLKNKSPYDDMFEIWDEKLASLGTKISIARNNFINRLQPIANNIHKNMTNGKEDLVLSYVSKFELQKTLEYDKIRMVFNALLKERYDLDLKRGFTSVGPHRDDLRVIVNDIDIRNYGSQGQQRTAALSLKLSEIQLIKDEINEYPIVLLDDVLSELDLQRQHDLLKSIENVQTILTTTHIEKVIDQSPISKKVYRIKNGVIIDS